MVGDHPGVPGPALGGVRHAPRGRYTAPNLRRPIGAIFFGNFDF